MAMPHGTENELIATDRRRSTSIQDKQAVLEKQRRSMRKGMTSFLSQSHALADPDVVTAPSL